MARRVLICLSHSIEEYDQVKLLHKLGYEVASIGGYIDPAHPHDGKRPPLFDVPCYVPVYEAVNALGTDDNFGVAQSWIPEGVLDWLGADSVIIYHHYLQRLFEQWEHLREWREAGGRVVWRTVGQSVEANEREAMPYRKQGLEVVRYSPNERRIPGYCGQDTLIRFYKDQDEWNGWVGDQKHVTNVTQQLKQRDPWTNYEFWYKATRDLPTMPLGPGSEEIGGAGEVPFERMQEELRHARCYLYTGTQPASYTLGLIEALMTGVPVVSIGPAWMTIFSFGPELFEGHELCLRYSDDSQVAGRMLYGFMKEEDEAYALSVEQRSLAVQEFGVNTVGAAWRAFLGEP